MFTKPIDEIEFEDVESFCKEWTEGVRVEYKREITVNRHIPKIVSSFANTYGGIFLIGVEADQKNNRVNSIPGIPQQNGIEEQIQQSALTGIYPGVIPEIKLIPVPNTENVVVIVRVDESVQAPHAIKEVTQVYVRVGSITQPYEYKLADMDRIAYMLKRREDSQVVARQILDRIEERINNLAPAFITIEGSERIYSDLPKFTVIARPVFPYRPVISASDIYKSMLIRPLRRVEGGVSHIRSDEYLELNEYGIVLHRVRLSISEHPFISEQQEIDYTQFIYHINDTILRIRNLYQKCEYLGNIQITAQLQNVLKMELIDPDKNPYRRTIMHNIEDTKCLNAEAFASKQCLSRDLESEENRKDLIEELVCQLLWAFNIPANQPRIRERIRVRIR